ncbi:MAG: dUTP diphosphatase [Actinomycetales bacterium]
MTKRGHEVMDGGGEGFKVFKIVPEATLPLRGTPGSVGYDLFSIEDKVLYAGTRDIFKIGLKMSIPSGWYGRIAPRSSLAWKQGIDTMGGVIDSDYRGEVGVILKNTGDKDHAFKKNDKIAQLILERAGVFEVEEVDDAKELGETERGNGGFGSTDRKEKVEEKVGGGESKC